MDISLYNLTRKQTTSLKGILIISVILHNYLHWTNKIGENEFQFESDRIFVFFNAIAKDPAIFFSAFFSYFGIYVLEIFIFITGYGLMKQFMVKKPVSYFQYLAPRLIKTYALMIFGLTSYFVILYPIGDTITLQGYWELVVSSLLLYNNFSYDTIFMHPYSGPLWYFSFIIQLYIIFPLLYTVFEKYKEKGFIGLLLVTYALTYILLPITEKLNFPMYANFLGHMPEFILGMAFAMFPQFRINYKVVIPALIIFILSNFFTAFFPLSFGVAAILFMWIFYPVYTSSTKTVSKILHFLGVISMFIFVTNFSTRKWAFMLTFNGEHSEWYYIMISLMHFCSTVLVAYISSKIYNKLYDPVVAKAISWTKKIKL